MIDMDTTASSTLIAEVPPEDGTIAAALADLDHKLVAWERAVADVHAALGESANRAAVTPEQIAPEQATPEKVGPETAGAGAASSLPVEVESSPIQAQEQAFPSVTDVAFDAPLTAPVSGALSSEAAGLAEAAAAEAEAEATAERVAAQAAAAAEEDERLLASLDPKKAKAIRIRRRLSNNSKSVRELLAE